MRYTMIVAMALAMPFAASQIAAAADGKTVYGKTCAVCHTKGLAGAPKLGDKPAWEPRIKQGTDALTASVIKGKGVMGPKGGDPSLSDADIKASVEYMLSQVK